MNATKALKIAWALLKGVAIPIFAGMLAWCVTYPLQSYSCHSYGDAKGIETKFQWFNCYVNDKGVWLEKTEYLSSKIGVKLIIDPEL